MAFLEMFSYYLNCIIHKVDIYFKEIHFAFSYKHRVTFIDISSFPVATDRWVAEPHTSN